MLALAVGGVRSIPQEQVLVEWLGCPCELRQSLVHYAAHLGGLLGDQLVGLYVHGSVARGCFSPATSDIDVIAVLAGPCTDEIARDVAGIHTVSDLPLDAVFVTQHHLRHDEVPTPVEFVLKPVGEGELRLRGERHPYFLLDRQDAYECSIALAGPGFSELAPPLPWHLVVDRLENLLPHIVLKFKNPTLMLCRIAYALAHGTLCSKRDAGLWALEGLGGTWRPLVQKSLDRYARGVPEDAEATEALLGLERHCRDVLVKMRGSGSG